MNGQTRYEMFVEIQQKKNLDILHLERLVETRWSYWFTSLKKIKLRFAEIKEVLKNYQNLQLMKKLKLHLMDF